MTGSEDPTLPPESSRSEGVTSAESGAGLSGGSNLGVPERIGPFEIIEMLGAGGMGVVYRARQERPRRDVALKVMRAGIMSTGARRRFELEVEVLGRLHHPGIAQVFQAGTFGEGVHAQPYFAMELVDGRPLLAFAEGRGLSVRDRLRLFCAICDGVEHAHQQGIVHRDLKPSNILVVDRSSSTIGGDGSDTGIGAPGQPKILDFGVARATDCDIQVSVQTDIGQLVGTLPYMSPEQVSGDPAAVDTRSDVYALGVVLFELLTGRLPYDLAGKHVTQAARIISELEPTRLGAADRSLRGDVETIALKALEKDKARRYQSAGELQADVMRYLRSEPIGARPASTAYQLRKFARRNKALVAGVASVFVVLIAGLAGTTWGLTQAVGEREEARRQAATAEAVNRFLNEDLLSQVSPRAMGKDVSMREVLDAAAGRIEGRFDEQPLVEAALRRTIAKTYSDLGDDEEAMVHGARAIDLLAARLGPADPETLDARVWLARWEMALGRFKEAEDALVKIREEARAAGSVSQTLNAEAALGWLYVTTDRTEEAERTLTHVIEGLRHEAGEDAEITFAAMGHLGILYSRNERYDESERLLRAVAEHHEEVLGAEHPATMSAKTNLAQVIVRRGDIEQALPLLAENLSVFRRVLGDDHPDTLVAINNMGDAYSRLGRYEEAEARYLESLERRIRVLGEGHPDLATAYNNLGQLYKKQERIDEALAQFAKVVDIRVAAFGNDHVQTMFARAYHGITLTELGRFSEAEPVLGELVASGERGLPGGHWYLGDFHMRYADCLRGLGRLDDAEAHYRTGYETLAASPDTRASRAQECAARLASLYEETGRSELAEAWHARTRAPAGGDSADASP